MMFDSIRGSTLIALDGSRKSLRSLSRLDYNSSSLESSASEQFDRWTNTLPFLLKKLSAGDSANLSYFRQLAGSEINNACKKRLVVFSEVQPHC